MQKITHKFINLDERDFHMHTSNFSDGLNTIEEIVQFAGKMGLKEICITDHSQAALDSFIERKIGFYTSTARWSLKHWQNVHNDVVVHFGVEGDILNPEGDTCFHIQGIEPEFIILSAHSDIYEGEPTTVTDATIRAMEKNQTKIAFVGHPDNNWDFGKYYNIEKLVDAANGFGIALEFNAKNLLLGKSNLKLTHYVLQNANKIYLNSDAHTLAHLRDARPFAIQFLKDNGYID
jgi:DNA polymerase (family X)